MTSTGTTGAAQSVARLVVAAPRAITSATTGFSVADAIGLFIVIVVIALVVVVVLALRPPRAGTRPARLERIKRAAEEDVEAIEEDNNFISPDAPGRQEDDL